MALTITPNLNDWTLCESSESGTWEVSNISNGNGYNTDEFLQGSSSYSGKVAAAGTAYIIYNYGSNVDLSSGANRVIRMWCRFMEIPKFNENGIRLYVEDSSGSYRDWAIGGGVDGPYSHLTTPQWQYIYVDTNLPALSASGTMTWSSIRKIGVRVVANAKPNRADNIFIDTIRYGAGLTVTGTNSVVGDGFAEIFAEDDDTSNKYGILQRLPGGGYLLTGRINFGDASGTGTTDFTDNTNPKIFIRDQEFYGGSLWPNDGFKITIQGNSTGDTDFQLGTVVGTGDDRRGILGGLFSSDFDKLGFDAETDTSDIDSCNLYGVAFINCGNIQLSGSTTQEAIGCTFLNCDEIQPNTAEFLNNTVAVPVPDRGLELASTSHNIKQINFIAGPTGDTQIDQCKSYSGISWTNDTVDINDAGANDVTLPSTGGLEIMFGNYSRFSGLKINVGTASSANQITWQYYNGSGWTALSGVSDGTNGFTTTGTNNVTWTMPNNWAIAGGTDGERPTYWVRAMLSTTVAGGALTQGWTLARIEHHLHVPTANTYTIQRLNFFGFGAAGTPKWHGENSSSGSVTINASESTILQNEFENTGGGSTTVNSVTPITLTGLVNPTEVRVYSAGTTTEIAGQENVTTGSYTFNAAVAASIDIVMHSVTYEHKRIEGYTVPSTATSIPIQQRFDRNYNNPE